MSSTGYAQSVLTKDGTLGPQIAVAAFGAVTGTTPATANTLLTITRDRGILAIENTLDADVYLTVNGVALVLVRTATARIYDLRAGLLELKLGLLHLHHWVLCLLLGLLLLSLCLIHLQQTLCSLS